MRPVTMIPPERRKCPLLGGRSCLQHQCMFWVRYDREQGDAIESCALVLPVYLQSQTIVEQIRTIATLDTARNENRSRQDQALRALLFLVGAINPAAAEAIAQDAGLPSGVDTKRLKAPS